MALSQETCCAGFHQTTLSTEEPDRYAQWKKRMADWQNAYYYCQRWLFYYARGDHKNAISDYTWSVKLYPDYAEAYFNRGLAYKSRGDKERAIADFNKTLVFGIDSARLARAIAALKEPGVQL